MGGARQGWSMPWRIIVDALPLQPVLAQGVAFSLQLQLVAILGRRAELDREFHQFVASKGVHVDRLAGLDGDSTGGRGSMA
jgi:hypothetical protein